MSRATILSRAAFVILVLATFTALFVAERLKQSDAPVSGVYVSRVISPNGDGVRDRARIRFSIAKPEIVTVEVVGAAGGVARSLIERREMRAGVHHVSWDGRGDRGVPPPDGRYAVRIALARSGRGFLSPESVTVDTTAPAPVVRKILPPVVTPGRGRRVTVDYRGGEVRRRAEFLVYAITAAGPRARPVASFVGSRHDSIGRWDGTVGGFMRRVKRCGHRYRRAGRSRPAPPGSYAIAVRVCDRAGNQGTGPRGLPPVRGAARGRPGVTVRYLEATPPPLPLRAGAVARIAVSDRVGGYRYRLRPAGGGRAVARGAGRGDELRIRLPRTESGLYILTLVATRGSHRADIPVAIAGARRARVLVVLPAIGWQGGNPVDGDRDGFGDTLATLAGDRRAAERAQGHEADRAAARDWLSRRRVTALSFARPLAAGRLPRGMRTGEAALLAHLRAKRMRFDVTTDVALDLNFDAAIRRGGRYGNNRRREGRSRTNRPRGARRYAAVVFAGDERHASPRLGVALRSYVESGGKVALFGLDSFRRTVHVEDAAGGLGRLRSPTARVERDIFGEAAARARIAPAPAVAFVDPLRVFREPAGLFTVFEQARERARGARVLVAAGRDPARPAVEVYRLGRGAVARVGVEGWAAQLGDPSVAAVNDALWRYLER